MICNRVIEDTHIFEKKNKYIVDTNVLLSLYGNKKYNQQIETNKKLKKAVQYYNRALAQKCTIYVPAIVISEFVNRFLTECWNEFQKKNPGKKLDKKKDYRNTKHYEKDCQYIKEVIEKEILSVLKPISDDFDKLPLNQMFKLDEDDFNDRLVIHIANKNNLYVISADVDIKKIKIK